MFSEAGTDADNWISPYLLKILISCGILDRQQQTDIVTYAYLQCSDLLHLKNYEVNWTLVSTVVHRRAIDQTRRQRVMRKRHVTLTDSMLSCFASTNPVEAQVLQKETKETIGRLLDPLKSKKPVYLAAILLYIHFDWGIQKITQSLLSALKRADGACEQEMYDTEQNTEAADLVKIILDFIDIQDHIKLECSKEEMYRVLYKRVETIFNRAKGYLKQASLDTAEHLV
jgi:hypothetical protein